MNRTMIAGAVLALFLAGCGEQSGDKPASAPAPTTTAPATPAPAADPATAPAAPTTSAPAADASAPAGAPSTAESKPSDSATSAGHPMDPKSPALETTPSYTAEESKQMAKDAADKTKEMAKDAKEAVTDAMKK